jgi:hypothetical protein
MVGHNNPARAPPYAEDLGTRRDEKGRPEERPFFIFASLNELS